MSSNTNDKSGETEVIVVDCPFKRRCRLPKNEELCIFPHFKVCPEYNIKAEKLKSDSFSLN